MVELQYSGRASPSTMEEEEVLEMEREAPKARVRRTLRRTARELLRPVSKLPERSQRMDPSSTCCVHCCIHHHAVVLLDLHQPLLPPYWIKKEETSSAPYVC